MEANAAAFHTTSATLTNVRWETHTHRARGKRTERSGKRSTAPSTAIRSTVIHSRPTVVAVRRQRHTEREREGESATAQEENFSKSERENSFSFRLCSFPLSFRVRAQPPAHAAAPHPPLGLPIAHLGRSLQFKAKRRERGKKG